MAPVDVKDVKTAATIQEQKEGGKDENANVVNEAKGKDKSRKREKKVRYCPLE